MNDGAMQERIIPSSGALLPCIGCGTWSNFDVGRSPKEQAPLAEVLRTLSAFGGSVLDSSPMYGRAEEVVGNLLSVETPEAPYFVATKVWTQGRDAGIVQMERSMRLYRQKRIDLMQIHNLVDWRIHLDTLRGWKAEGRVRYFGVTHYAASAYSELEEVMRRETLDFVQFNYSLEERLAERLLLPLAADRGIAVLVNLPFGAGRAFRGVRGKTVPPWAVEFGCETWAQVLLKFILSHPAVTCVIPGTGQAEHMAENCRAGIGKFFDKRLCDKLRKFWDTECK